MPVYYFDLATPETLERDEVGVEFGDLDAAYLDACQAALELSVEMMRERRNPHDAAFLVRDGAGRRLMEIPFGEMLRSRPRPRPSGDQAEAHRALNEVIARSRKLRAELRAKVSEAQATVRETRTLLDAAQKR